MRKDEYKKTTNAQMLDISIKQTLTRTIYTSLTTVLSVALVAGTYSSIFISGTIWSFIYNKEKDRRLQKRIADEKNKEKKKLAAGENPDDKIVV